MHGDFAKLFSNFPILNFFYLHFSDFTTEKKRRSIHPAPPIGARENGHIPTPKIGEKTKTVTSVAALLTAKKGV